MWNRVFYKIFLTITVLVSFSYLSESNQSKDLKMKVGIFQIPSWQIIVKSEPSPKTKTGEAGGIRGTQTGGPVTVYFPDGIVLLVTDRLPKNEDLYEVIKKKVKFPNLTRIFPIGNIYFLIDTEKLDATVIDEEVEIYPPRRRHRIKEFSLHFMPVGADSEAVVVNVKFSVQADENNPDKKKLMDQTFGVPNSRTLLVGFPRNDESGRGTVYWLAFTIES